MGRYYRYKLPPWARRCIFVLERITLPILIFQLLRTIFFVTTFDLILLGLLVCLLVTFYLEWI
ncbi:hypothetical protein CV093_12720 [Oceanobacillus sp. 143]|uniref:Membrane protein YszA n=1 Tax=Oceanobacillus zhaokaii TaxID=2052660 RepID=A0A345PHW7_9BACI|nr:hypothetical protein [Oceanobacillus zhaokaii]AXI09597.1 hypothetical protein CUC15_11980 [Oceanobacillus zhaokaii]QGS68959.1 hypothetical protein CV093_12720 [Oceanobacillus sp. 143]